MSDLQRDIETIRRALSVSPYVGAGIPELERLRSRLTPDRERVFEAITSTLIKFGHDDPIMLQDCIFAADAAIKVMEQGNNDS